MLDKAKFLFSGALSSFLVMSNNGVDSLTTNLGQTSDLTQELIKGLLAVIVSFLTQLIHKKIHERSKKNSA